MACAFLRSPGAAGDARENPSPAVGQQEHQLTRDLLRLPPRPASRRPSLASDFSEEGAWAWLL